MKALINTRFPTVTLVYTFDGSDQEYEFTVQARSVDFAKADMYISLRLNGEARRPQVIRYEIGE